MIKQFAAYLSAKVVREARMVRFPLMIGQGKLSPLKIILRLEIGLCRRSLKNWLTAGDYNEVECEDKLGV